jgi:hypothetical protein
MVIAWPQQKQTQHELGYTIFNLGLFVWGIQNLLV